MQNFKILENLSDITSVIEISEAFFKGFPLTVLYKQQLYGVLIEVPERIMDEDLPWVFVMIHIKATKNP